MLEGLKGQEGRAPGKGADQVGVIVENVKGGARILAGEESGEDLGRVVGRLLALEDGARRLEKL